MQRPDRQQGTKVRRALIIALIVVSAVAFIAPAAVSLYRYFIDSRIRDEGRMENPDSYRAEKELLEFRWQQTNANSADCFTLHFYLEDDLPVLTGRFLSPDGGETRENGVDASSDLIPWQLTWVQWFELQNALAEAALPAYEKPSPDVRDEADSEICIVWRSEDEEITERRSGRNAAALENLVLRIAEETYRASQLEASLPPELGAETAVLPRSASKNG